jgi:hypothetical protein
MRFRKLRIAFSATCLIACVLLVALWVRSYWWHDRAWWAPSSSRLFTLISWQGRISFFHGTHERSEAGYYPSGRGWAALSYKDIRPEHGTPHWSYSSDTDWIFVLFPHWLPLPFFVVLTAAPWLAKLRWRFSLRTLLIATTLVAVVLGLIVYATRQ